MQTRKKTTPIQTPDPTPEPMPVALTPLQQAHENMRLRREAGEVIVRRDPIEKAKLKPTSLRLAITAKCWDCIGGTSDSNPRARIRDCGVTKCPLYTVRPFQEAKGNSGFVDEEDDE